MRTTDASIPPRVRLFEWIDATFPIIRRTRDYRKIVVCAPDSGLYEIILKVDLKEPVLYLYVANSQHSVVVNWRCNGPVLEVHHALQTLRSDWQGHSWDQQITPPPPMQVVQCVHLILSVWVELSTQ